MPDGSVSAAGAGLFVAFEGVEGSGKTTQARLLAEWLERHRIPYVAVREPGGTPLGEKLRQLLLHEGEVPAVVELMLLLAARAQLVERVIRPGLAAGRVVVVDRYELSTLAYQAYGRGLPVAEVRRLNEYATGGLRPDLTLLLDVPPEEGIARRERTGRQADRIEGAGAEFHRRVAEAYSLLAEMVSDVELVDGTEPAERIHGRVVKRLCSGWPETLSVREG